MTRLRVTPSAHQPPVASSLAEGDAELIAASLEVPSVFGTIFDRHWSAIRRFCMSRAGVAGEDLAAEAFRVAFDTRSGFDSCYASARPWLYGIATNLLRHWFRRQEIERRQEARIGEDIAYDLTSETLNRVEAQQLGPELAAALVSVSTVDRDALMLFAWADLSYAEIAEATGVPVGTVRSRIHRARTLVRTHLLSPPEDH